jgi:serine/threonine protein kinase
VQLVDVASIETGEPPCLVLEKLPGPALSSYLDDAQVLSAGQAVTILAPLCGALQTLHDAGVTHGAIHVRRIVFDERGAPALTGFGRGKLRESPDARRAAAWPDGRVRAQASDGFREDPWRASVLDDQRDLLAIVHEVLGRVEPSRARRSIDIEALSQEIGSGPSRSFLARLESVLFAFAPPEVVSRSRSGPHAESPAPSHSGPRARSGGAVAEDPIDYDWSTSAPAPSPEPSENRLISALRILGASSAALEMVSSVIDTATRLGGRRRSSVRPSSPELELGPKNPSRRIGRRPLLVGVSCAVLATAALLLALPSSGDEARAGAADSGSTDTSSTDVPATGSALPAADESPSLLGDDPAEALRALSRTNDGCPAASDENACREKVFDHDYLHADTAEDSPIVIDAVDAQVTGVWGGSALVSAGLNGQPASFLLVKGEAGWRVRGIFLSDQ